MDFFINRKYQSLYIGIINPYYQIYYEKINMKNIKQFIGIITLFVLFGCGDSNEKVYSELERLDNSLDSLITEKTYNNPKYLIFIGDTLKNNPIQIEDTYYQKIDNDSTLVDANCHVYKFKNNQLIINSSEDILGHKYVQKYIYFKDKIDNKLIQTLRDKNKNTDTIIFGCLEKYKADGKLVKSITSNVWKEVGKNSGQLTVNDNRILDVYRYNQEKGFYTTFRKEYFNKKYDTDNLKKVIVKKFNTDINKKSKDIFDYSYSYDNYGNWIVKRQINDKYPSVIYRKIIYK